MVALGVSRRLRLIGQRRRYLGAGRESEGGGVEWGTGRGSRWDKWVAPSRRGRQSGLPYSSPPSDVGVGDIRQFGQSRPKWMSPLDEHFAPVV